MLGINPANFGIIHVALGIENIEGRLAAELELVIDAFGGKPQRFQLHRHRFPLCTGRFEVAKRVPDVEARLTDGFIACQLGSLETG